MPVTVSPDAVIQRGYTHGQATPLVDLDWRCLPGEYQRQEVTTKAAGMLTYLESSEYVLKVPPSPSLSACRISKMYLTVTIKVIDHKTSDNAPSRSAWIGASVNVEENT